MLHIIAALALDRVIGINNRLPWHLPADLAHFKSLTWGHTIIMGRKTFESIGKPLPGRSNGVLTRDTTWQAPPGVKPIYDPTVILQWSRAQDIYIIGGYSIYQWYLPYTQRLELTYIDAKFDGDAYFPDFDESEWTERSRESHTRDEKNPYHYQFVSLTRAS